MHPDPRFNSPVMSAATATLYVRRMVEREADGEGDIPNAIERVARRWGLTKWQVERLRKGRSKTVDVGLFVKLRVAYLAECERQISKLQQELALERAMGADLDDMVDFDREAAELAAKVAKAKAAAQRIHRD